MKTAFSITLVACIASASAFAPSALQNVAQRNTELNAKPKLANKKAAVGKTKAAGGKPVAGNKKAAISFPTPQFSFPWDKTEAVAPVKAAPGKKGRSKLADKKKGTSISSIVFDMDLFAPVSDQNDYGARRKMNLKAGELSKRSYVPAGLTKAQYEKARAKDVKKKDKYDYNVSKAGKFSDFYAFYKNRGTDTKDSWRDVTNSHPMAKPKFDWQGDDDLAGR